MGAGEAMPYEAVVDEEVDEPDDESFELDELDEESDELDVLDSDDVPVDDFVEDERLSFL